MTRTGKRAKRKTPTRRRPRKADLEHIAPDLRPLAVPVGSLNLDPKNARVHTDTDLRETRRSLERFGQREPIIVQKAGKVVRAGNARLMVARELGWSHIAALVIDEPTSDAVAFALAHNRTGERAAWDPAILAELFRELQDVGDLDVPGWSAKEAAEVLASIEAGIDETKPPAEPAPDPGEDEGEPEPPIPHPPKRATTKFGDVYELGRSRLVCGDARERKAVAAALNSEEPAGLLVTDPPYCSGSNQEAGKRAGTFGDIASDNLSARGYRSLIQQALTAARAQACYVFTDWRMWVQLYDVVESSGLAARAMLVWDKGTPALGYLWRTQHELVLFASRKGMQRRKGTPGLANVIRCKRSGNHNHHTEKPVELMATLLEGDDSSSRVGCPVLDPFAGSGSTLLAAERRERQCGAIEIEPKWCDVIVERWEQVTGEKAKRKRGAAL